MIEPVWTYGAIAGLITTILGFGATLLYQAYRLGSYAASNEGHLKHLTEKMGEFSDRMAALEKNEEKMTTILVEMAQNKSELQMLSRRIDDVQQHGSYKLAEILQSLRASNDRRYEQK